MRISDWSSDVCSSDLAARLCETSACLPWRQLYYRYDKLRPATYRRLAARFRAGERGQLGICARLLCRMRHAFGLRDVQDQFLTGCLWLDRLDRSRDRLLRFYRHRNIERGPTGREWSRERVCHSV